MRDFYSDMFFCGKNKQVRAYIVFSSLRYYLSLLMVFVVEIRGNRKIARGISRFHVDEFLLQLNGLRLPVS